MDRYRYEEKCYYRHRYDTDLIIGGTLISMQHACVLARYIHRTSDRHA